MQDLLTSSPETAETQTPKTDVPEPEQKSKIEQLADIFREEPETAPTGEPVERQEKGKPKGLKDAAEMLGLKPEDLYAMEITMADGKTKTLGQLKDAAAKEGDLTLRELQFEESRSRKESDLIRAQSELRELIGALPQDAIKPEVLGAIRQKHEATLKQERARTLELIPEWKDEAKRTEELSEIVEHLKGYGFPPAYLQTIFDSRALKFIRDSVMREKRIRLALEKVKETAPTPPPRSRPAGVPKKPQNSTTTARPGDKRAALLQLFE